MTGMGVRDLEVRKIQKIFFELLRPRVNFGRKQKVDLQIFVPEGHPKVASVAGKVPNLEKAPVRSIAR